MSLNASGAYALVDGNGLFQNDDGSAYNVYTSEAQDHRVSIEALTGDYTGTAGHNLGLFPDHYVEGAVLFKRGAKFYVAYGSCCCFCRGGSGVVVYSAPALAGPWTRQPLDLNCNRTDAGDICGGAWGARTHTHTHTHARTRARRSVCSVAVASPHIMRRHRSLRGAPQRSDSHQCAGDWALAHSAREW